MHTGLARYPVLLLGNKCCGIQEVGLAAPSQSAIPGRSRLLVRRAEDGGQKARMCLGVGVLVHDLKPSQPRRAVLLQNLCCRVDPQRRILDAEAKRWRWGSARRGN